MFFLCFLTPTNRFAADGQEQFFDNWAALQNDASLIKIAILIREQYQINAYSLPLASRRSTLPQADSGG